MSSLSQTLFSQETYTTLKNKIETAKTIAIFGHENVDWDALWSMLWFGSILESLGKNISYFTTIEPANSYYFIPWIDKIRTDFDYKTYDIIIFLDFSWYSRIQWFTQGHEDYFDSTYKIVIDHHLDAKIRWNLELKDTQSTSCCGLLAEICQDIWPEYITPKIATYFYLGLTTDSGNFMRWYDAARDFHIAASLLSLWADKEFIIKNFFFSNKSGIIDMGKLIFTRATKYKNILYTWYTKDELNTYHLDDDDVEWIQMTLRGIKNTPVYVRLRYMWDVWNGSMRSGWTENDKRISVQKIAITFAKWGWHSFAAWFTTPHDNTLSLEENIKTIINHIEEEAIKQL